MTEYNESEIDKAKNKIKVMNAFINGGTIEVCPNHGKNMKWEKILSPTWDWENNTYRAYSQLLVEGMILFSTKDIKFYKIINVHNHFATLIPLNNDLTEIIDENNKSEIKVPSNEETAQKEGFIPLNKLICYWEVLDRSNCKSTRDVWTIRDSKLTLEEFIEYYNFKISDFGKRFRPLIKLGVESLNIGEVECK